jgi:translocation and assembly module TamA
VRRTRAAIFAHKPLQQALLGAFVGAFLGLAPNVAQAAAEEPKAQVQGNLDHALRLAIQRAIGVSKSKPATRLDARRRAREAGELAIAVLRSEGYYDYTVEPDVGEGGTPTAIVRITLGPRSAIAAPTVVWVGEPPDPDTLAAAQKALALTPGAPGRAADVLAAEGRLVAALRSRGYADVVAKPRQVVVDHADHTLRPTFHLAAGEIAHLDGVKVISHGRTRPAWVAMLAPWRRGDVYNPAKVAELERRLTDAGVYNSITVSLAPADESVDGLRPVIVSLGDRPPRTLELGAGYSTSEGAGVDAKLLLYNQLGRADTVTLTGKLAQIQQLIDAELALPDWKRPDQVFKVGGNVFGNDTTAYNDYGFGFRADIERHWTKTTFLTYGGAFDGVDTLEKDAINANGIAVGQHLKLAIFSLLGAYNLDRSNDPLNPTRGWRAEVRAEPTYVTGDRTLPYLKLTSQVSGYVPVQSDGATVLAARIKLGSIVGGDIPTVPADRRFYSGGGGSVRGFIYQGVGPRLADKDKTPVGGASLFEASAEVRQQVSGPWGVAAFVDAGSVGPTAAPDFKSLSVGAGVGVRYNLGFGPIRLDIAAPVTHVKGDPWVQFYISIGQSF